MARYPSIPSRWWVPQHLDLLCPPDSMISQGSHLFPRKKRRLISLFLPILISKAKILLVLGFLELGSVMICVSNIVKMGIQRNCLFQLAKDAHRNAVRVISGRNFLLPCSHGYAFLVIHHAPAVKAEISMVHFNARQLAWSRL